MSRTWTADQLLELGRSYQPAAVFVAAAELEIFDALTRGPRSAQEMARKRNCDARALTMLLDALVALELLKKQTGRYRLVEGTESFLTAKGDHSIVAMAQHQANCCRRWAQLAHVVKSGRPPEKMASVRGYEGDAASFIGAMHNVSAPHADRVVRSLRPIQFQHVLDLGGASGTWTIALLRACPQAKGTLLDLPHVIPLAKRRVAAAGLSRRVKLVGGDFMRDCLPSGVDLAWVSAIVHQNSREQNRMLFTKVYQALVPGGRIAIRDIIMDESRTRPASGALFAINMLVATPCGGTFTLRELREDLGRAGFSRAALVRKDPAMNSVLVAEKGDKP